jgi:carbon-monoxide dehydrogenase medium subunit
MYPEPIEHYHAPRTLADALDLLAQAGGDTAILAGGQSLLPLMKARVAKPRVIVDINHVADLDGIRFDADGALEIGALVRLATAAQAPRLTGPRGALADAAAGIGDRQVRNRGTLVGSVVFGANWGDVAPAVAVLDGEVILAHAETGATRRIAIGEFMSAAYRAHPRRGDLVTAIRLPQPAATSASAYLKHGRVAQDRATLGVAVWLALDDRRACAEIRIAIGGLRQPIERAGAVEAMLHGQRLSPELMDEAGALAATTLESQSDELASADYRSQLLRACLPRALACALERV